MKPFGVSMSLAAVALMASATAQATVVTTVSYGPTTPTTPSAGYTTIFADGEFGQVGHVPVPGTSGENLLQAPGVTFSANRAQFSASFAPEHLAASYPILNQDSRMMFANTLAGTVPSYMLIDLGSVNNISQINTYAAHSGATTSSARNWQRYHIFGAVGDEAGLVLLPNDATDPTEVPFLGWTVIGYVDTFDNTNPNDPNNRRIAPFRDNGVMWTDTSGSLGDFRYILMAILPADDTANGHGTVYYRMEVIPEPASLALMGLGGLALIARRRRQ